MKRLGLAMMVAMLTGAGALNGCRGARSVSAQAWRSSLETYVQEQANGDLNALRQTRVATDRPGYALLATDRPEKSHDINGVLAGVHRAAGRLWYVFIVGDVQKERLQSAHAAAVAGGESGYLWRIGSSDSKSAETWRRGHQRAAAAADPGETPVLAFPQPEDVFVLRAAGDVITVEEEVSGAQWTLNLAQESQAGGND